MMIATGLMVLSAITHAIIGVILKRSPDKLVLRALIGITSSCVAFPLLFFVPFPTPAMWIYLAIGAAIHLAYQLCQVAAFQRGDMSLVYPIMRGLSPALAGIFAFLHLDETLSLTSMIGLLIAVCALIGFAWSGNAGDRRLRNISIGFALLCGVMIGLYSVTDGAGMRLSRESLGQVWTYLVYFFWLDGLVILGVVIFRRGSDISAALQSEIKPGVTAGLLSLLSFGAALWALSLAPIAQMSAIRESSVIFGAVFAALILKESFGRRRGALAVVLFSGLFLMQIG